MKHVDLEDVPGGKPEKGRSRERTYLVEEECPWSPGVRMTSAESDMSIVLDGKSCTCETTLEYRVTHEFDRYRQDPMIGGPGFGNTPIYKRVENVVCPKCGALHSAEVYKKWREEKYPRLAGAIDMEAIKKMYLRNRGITPPSPGHYPGRRRTDDNTRYRTRA